MPSTQRRWFCYVTWSLCVVSTTGCAELQNWLHNDFKVGPNYCPPTAAISDAWIDFNNPRVISQAQAVDEGAWWRALNDPVLDQLVHQAYQQNLSLRAAGMRVLEARAQRLIAAGSLFPQIQEGFGSYDHTQFSRVGNAFGAPVLPRTVDSWTTGFDVGWELDVWGRFRRNLESADANLDALIENYDDVLVSLIAETAASYVEIREFEQRLRYARDNVEAQRGSLRIAESRFKNGAVSELDVALAKTNLAQTEALIPTFERGLRLANNRLCVLLGTPPRDLRPEIGSASIPSAPSQVVVGIPAELLRRRPDVRQSERQLAAQSALIGVAVADLFPAFTINGSINWQANQFEDMFSSAANGGTINPAFNWKILNYGRLRNNIRAQDAKFQELALLYKEAVLKANAEVEDAIVSYLKAHDEIRVLQESVKAAERSQELVLTKYREGDVDISAVFITQATLVPQQDNLAAAQAELAFSLIRIYKALGGGWQIRAGQLATSESVMSEFAAPESTRLSSPSSSVTTRLPGVES